MCATLSENGVEIINQLGAPIVERDVTATQHEGGWSRRCLRVAASLTLGLLVIACGGGGTSPPPAVATITTQPNDQSVAAGATATFSVTATDAIGYQWQKSSDSGASFANISSATSSAYTTPLTTTSDSGTQFRVVVAGAGNSIASADARLTVTAAVVAPSFVTQPQGQSVVAPASASFTAAANGYPSPTLQWQMSTDSGSTWSNIGGATSATFTTPATVAGDNGKQFRVVASNSAGTILSSAALLTVTSISVAPLRYFSGTDGSTGAELWKTDGTAAGTVLVKDINPGSAGSSPSNFTAFKGAVYFAALDGTARGLWRTDGTATGTVPVAPGSGIQSLGFLTVFNNTLYFQADDGVHGAELWKTDGTAAGTVMIKDINPTSSSAPSAFTVFNGALYFHADDGSHGRELWKTDGSAAGTVLVKDINPGLAGSNPFRFSILNGELQFTASDGVTGFELWKTDGTPVGTVLVKDINPGAGSGM